MRTALSAQGVSIPMFRRGTASPLHLYLLEPKYRLAGYPPANRPTKTDIDKMHAYRDAIRDTSGARVVVSVATLYPGPTVPYGHGIEAIQSDPDQPQRLTEPVSDILTLALSDIEPTAS